MLNTITIQEVIESISNSYGDSFLQKMTQSLAHAVDADYCFIASIDSAMTTASSITLYAHGQMIENFTYALDGTPCQMVAQDGVDIYPENVTQLFPEDLLLAEMGIEAYIGSNLKDSQGNVLGLVVAMYENKVLDPIPIHTLFNLFSGRIAAEMDRMNKASELEQANSTLEQHVQERTQALEDALEKLKLNQKQLIEQEKYASLGTLVAGVAHEINTPLGVAVTTASAIGSETLSIEKAIDANNLTTEQLSASIQYLNKLSPILYKNLRQAAQLVNNFKLVAVEQSDLHRSQFHLKNLIDTILSNLHTEIIKHPVQIKNQVAETIQVESYMGDFIQIFSNLIMNSLLHAFSGRKIGCITIDAQQSAQQLNIQVHDDGIGIAPEHREQIYDPFFTTKRGKGGTGLGLNIVYNIVHQKLNGKLSLESTPGQGSSFFIELPTP